MCSQVLLDGDEDILVVRAGNNEVLVFFVTQQEEFCITRTRVCAVPVINYVYSTESICEPGL